MNIDNLISGFDRALRVVSGVSRAQRISPADAVAEEVMTERDCRRSAGLMRVNHVGEVCAQALYSAQAQFARSDQLRQQFVMAGREEMDHLAWTTQRLQELGSHASLLNPLWYAGAFVLGAVAARAGENQSLGFVVETERQVEAHLESHLSALPAHDAKSLAIVMQMRDDEARHGADAQALGAAKMPKPLQFAMSGFAKVMTTTAYYI